MSASSNTKTPNLLPSLRRRLPAATFILLNDIVDYAEQQGAPIYLVGGFVRDLLLKRPSLDLDLVLEGDALQLGRTLVKRFSGRLVAHKAFGTAIWWLPQDKAPLLRKLRIVKRKNVSLPEFFDLITARRENYRYPAALPSVRFAGIREDLYRRDFTVNTLALRLDGADAGELLDLWGGVQDLRARLLRTLHPASFSDDPTRILRILRLAARLKFRIEQETRIQLNGHLPMLKEVSGERIRTELELTLLENERAPSLRSMQKTGVLRTIHPRLRFSGESARTLAQIKPVPALWNLADVSNSDLGFALWLMHSSPADVADIAVRLSFRADLRDAILGAAKLHQSSKELSHLSVSKFVERLEGFNNLSVYSLYLAEGDSSLARRLKLYAAKWRQIRSHINGNHLRKLGLKPGPDYKYILGNLRAAWLDGKIRTIKQEQALLENLLNEHR